MTMFNSHNAHRASPVAVLFLILVSPILVSSILVSPKNVFAHAGEKHDDPGVSLSTEQAGVAEPVGQDGQAQGATPSTTTVLPKDIADIGGPFSLINHFGESVTEQTYLGKHTLVFFGYSNCQVMCSISLKRIADALTILQGDADDPLSKFQPLVITVDPANDTPKQLRDSLSGFHPSLMGLTGTLEQLKPVYSAYRQKPSILDYELNNNPIVSHTSYFYLMGPDGKLQTFFPPILSAESMASVIKRYLPI